MKVIATNDNIQELLAEKTALENQLYILLNRIKSYSDGYDYVVIIHSYGSHSKVKCSNIHAAYEIAKEYYGDNGFANIYTNNKEVLLELSGGEIYYHSNPLSVSVYTK